MARPEKPRSLEPEAPGRGAGPARWLVPVAAALALGALTALAVFLWPGPFRREVLGRALAVEVALVLLSALNYSGFLWGRRTFLELVTAQPHPRPKNWPGGTSCSSSWRWRGRCCSSCGCWLRAEGGRWAVGRRPQVRPAAGGPGTGRGPTGLGG